MSKNLKAGTILVTSLGLAEIQGSCKSADAPGYQIINLTPRAHDGWGTHFMPEWCAKPAIVGLSVCETVAGGCWCGLRHVDSQLLRKLPRVPAQVRVDALPDSAFL